MSNRYVEVCGIRFFLCDYNYISSLLSKAPKEKLIFAPLATHPVMEARSNPKLKDLYGGINHILPDGYVAWAIHLLYGVQQERMYGPDLLLHISQRLEKSKTAVFICGNNCDQIEYSLKKSFPHLIIAGTYEMKGEIYNSKTAKKVKKAILKTKTSCVFIGIGSPNQHFLASALDVHIPIVCVGAGFNLVSGLEKQAPKWMRDNGLEWLFRLIQNPRRLWKRYLIYGPVFIYHIVLKRLINSLN